MSEGAGFKTALVRLMAIVTGSGVLVFGVREKHAELGNKACGLCGREKRFAKTRKRISSRVLRRSFHVAVGTDARRGSLAREKLLPMTIKTARVLGKLGDIRKRGVALTNVLPVGGGKLVTRAACQLLASDVGRMRKAGVVRARGRWAPAGAPLRLNRQAGKSEGNYQKCRQS